MLKRNLESIKKDLLKYNTENLSDKYTILQFENYSNILKEVEKQHPYKFNNA